MLLSYCAKVDYRIFSLFHMPSFVLESDRNKSGSFLFLLMTTDEIRTFIQTNELWRFYKSKEWIALKTQILEENHYECRICKNSGVVTRYDVDKDGNKSLLSTVHHVQWLKKYPELALSRTYMWNGKEYPNLIPVCKACHNKCHKEKAWHKPKSFWQPERW